MSLDLLHLASTPSEEVLELGVEAKECDISFSGHHVAQLRRATCLWELEVDSRLPRYWQASQLGARRQEKGPSAP
jgi:hypothetical protein